jgi:hypothetical protein
MGLLERIRRQKVKKLDPYRTDNSIDKIGYELTDSIVRLIADLLLTLKLILKLLLGIILAIVRTVLRII